MDKWFRSKWFVRAVALVLACFLYFVAYTESDTKPKDYSFFGGTDETKVLEDVPVNVRIDAQKYVVSGIPETVSVTVEGSTSNITRADKQRNFEVYVDLRNLGEGEHTVEIEYTNMPEGLAVYIEPKSIDVVIEERSTKEFSISADFLNKDQLPDGYELGEYKVEPQKVKITSSKSVIEKISLVKVFVNVAGLTESINNREVPVKVYDSQGNELRVRIEPENVIVSAEINNPSKTVPVKVETKGKLPDGLTLEDMDVNVKEVEIFGTSTALDDIKEIKTEVIDLSKVNKTGTIEAKLDIPKGIIIPETSEVAISVSLKQTKVFKDISISAENTADNLDVQFVQPNQGQMSITVVGNEEIVRELRTTNFHIRVDTKDLEVGEHRVPIEIEGPDDVDIEGEMKQVTIEIVEK
ncbi:YbbR-like domain-containing protein [Virgibacillus soli]|uniref:CdaR family protein n=1 Tax=Paracerasibacillus soli TaxID=480284 RepID=UPI0035EB440D